MGLEAFWFGGFVPDQDPVCAVVEGVGVAGELFEVSAVNGGMIGKLP